jgi:hypothetical protein
MSRKPKPGGAVMISGKRYDVLERPTRCGDFYHIMVRAANGGEYWAQSELWRHGCGPWKIVDPVVDAG